MKHATLSAIEYHLPQQILSNEQLAEDSSQWTSDQIASKTGIKERRITADDEFASDLAVAAAKKLFDRGVCQPEEIDFLLLCTQSPDYLLPTTACILQDRLGLSNSAGALDFNLGCSGYIYGAGLAKGLIETGQANQVLLLTADTYTKFIQADDMNVRTLFGDAAAAEAALGATLGAADAQFAPIAGLSLGKLKKRHVLETRQLRRQLSDPAVTAASSLIILGGACPAALQRPCLSRRRPLGGMNESDQFCTVLG